jgi:hypothetical protein
MLGMCVIPLYNIVDAPLGVGINARLPFDVTKVRDIADLVFL